MEWLDVRHPEYVDRLGDLVAKGRIEIVGGAFELVEDEHGSLVGSQRLECFLDPLEGLSSLGLLTG
mgnify:CR=1 FL=1